MDETRDQVVQLLNEAAASTDAEAKLHNLQMVQELTVNKEPELLDNFFEEILQFQHDRSVNIRKHLIGWFLHSCTKWKSIYHPFDTFSIFVYLAHSQLQSYCQTIAICLCDSNLHDQFRLCGSILQEGLGIASTCSTNTTAPASRWNCWD